MSAVDLILVAPCSLLLGAVLQIFVAKLVSARTKGILATLFCVPSLVAVAALVRLFQTGQALDVNLFGWDGPLALALHVDALSVLFALMGAGIGGFVLLYSIGYMAHDESATRFYATMLVFIGGFIGLVYSANLFILYLCWEVVGLCSFSLVGFWYTNPEAVNGARKVLLMTHIAGYGLLAAILVIFHRTGSALWTDPAVAHAFTGGVFVLMLVALVAKSVQVPLHTWIPEAMAAPTPVSALLHAACYVKAGVYLAARMHSFGTWPAPWGEMLMWIGTVTMAVGVMYAMVQTDLKRMLAFSTVSQIGYMMMGLGIGTPLAITAGLLHCLNHGFFKGGLFLTSGSVQHAAGTRDMNQLGGLAGRMPQTTLSWLIGVGAMMGFPLMSGFASKWMLYAAALQAGQVAPAVIAWAVSLGTVFMGVKATSAVFLGPLPDNIKDPHESPASMIWGMGFLAAGSVILGIAPQLAVNTLLNPILRSLSLGAGVHVTWFGLSSEAGTFSTTGGLVLALVSLVIGGAIYALAYVARPVAVTADGAAMAGADGGVFTGGEPLPDADRLTAGDFSKIFQQNWQSFFRWSNVDKAYLAVWEGLQAVSRGLGAAVAPLERNATALVLVLAAAVFALIRWLIPGVQSVGPGAPHAPASMPAVLISACGLAAIALVVAALANTKSRKQVPLLLLTGAATVAGLVVTEPGFRLGLLELGALLTIALVWQTAHAGAARFTYLAVVLVSAVSMAASEFAYNPQDQAWSRALILTSILVKLAAVPLCFWLLSLADELPAVVLGMIIAVVDMAAFGEFWTRVPDLPSVLTPQWLLLAVAGATSLIGALLMLTQRSLKRLLVLSTIEDAGFLLLGTACATQLGTEGAMLAAVTHALAKALLFTCLSAPENAGELDDKGGLTARFPLSGFGFLFGMLAMLGVPPLLGFAGRWRLYESAYLMHPALAAIFILSSVFALIAYVQALAGQWWGRNPYPNAKADCKTGPPREVFLVKAVVVTLVVVLLAAGSWPGLLQFVQGGR